MKAVQANKERDLQRSVFLNLASKVEEKIELSNIDNEMKVMFKKLKFTYRILCDLDKIIKNDILCAKTYNAYHLVEELVGQEKYRDRMFSIEERVAQLFSQDDISKKIYKLPEIKLKKFDGAVKNWPSFWKEFKKIHSDPNIEDDDKFMLLKQTLEEGTDIYAFVESYPISDYSYLSCIQELQNIYGRQEKLIEFHVRELMKLVFQEKTNSELNAFYDKLNENVKALYSLGMTKCAAFVLPLAEHALPKNTLRLWERNKSLFQSKSYDDILEEFMLFLKLESETILKAKKAKEELMRGESPEPSGKKVCIWCENDTHYSIECFKLIKSLQLQK